MPKQFFFNQDARESVRKGINIVGDAASSTLGPMGKTVLIASGYGHMPIVTKDGVTVVKSSFIEDEVENVGVMMIRYAAEKTLEQCGDGTTTSALLAQSILNNAMDSIKETTNVQEVKSGIEKAVNCVVDNLKKIATPVRANATIKNVATISANNDAEIGGLIAAVYDKIGHRGLLTIEDSKTIETYIKVMDGSEMPRGYASDKFVTNPDKMEVVYENPSIFVFDYEIKTLREIEPLMKQIYESEASFSKPIILIARGFDGEVFNTMIVNKVKNGVKICLVCAPTSYQREALRDVACLTGAKLISDEGGLKPEHAMYADHGSCEKIIISKSSTLILKGATDKEELEFIKKEINLELGSTTNDQLKEILEKRLARLSGAIGVIYVGGATDVETKERKDRVDDAVRAVKSAIEEGVVVGGGVALIRCIKQLDDIIVVGDEKLGVELIEKACMAPLQKMLKNACLSELIADDVLKKTGDDGYNVKTGESCDLFKAGIIDPVKVVRCALQNASSVASQVIGSDVLMVEMRPKD